MDYNKNKKIFTKNIEPEYKRIFAFIYSRLDKNKELAQDITQNTMEIAWLKIDQIKNVESTRAWLMQIAMNEIRKYFRMQSSKKGAYIKKKAMNCIVVKFQSNPSN